MQTSHQTVVVTQQPIMSGKSNMMVCSLNGHRDWDSGLMACCTDCRSLLMTYFCLPCSLCDISSRTGECMCMPFCVAGGLLALRARIRTLGGIQGSICGDCIAISCCGLCAICQMQRELDAMGL
ncbi:cornifelin homolog [Dreissena polymorpha]|uniref:Cornifelin n=1 Tax=Dreissena polymorpha TaxID=45954 RepID=A0A9D4N6U7_DREPO|nr:cornifelin homolog [Dreissena polymorpha]KAH3888953.1 hypothetical protein DPMN_012998 [Dreissena polymorpha]